MKLIALLTLLIIGFWEPLSASSSLSFKRYQVEDGLSHNTVWCAMQDSYGFIWFGTSDGLNCYNGRTNKVYRNVLNDKYSLENNFVQALFEEENRNIWVGTNWGLYIYDRNQDRFTYFNKKTSYGVLISSEVKKIIKTQNGLIWIATLGQGLFIYDPKTDVLTQNSLYTSFVWDICETDLHHVYASSLQDGLFCFDGNGHFMQSPPELSVLNSSPGKNKINCIQNVGGVVWMGADSNILYKWDEARGRLESFTATPLSLGALRCIVDYSENELLIGTDNGLYFFDCETSVFTRADNPSDGDSLSDQFVNSMLKDAEGGLWVMTNLGGINYASKQTKYFEAYHSVNPNDKEDAGIVVGPFCEDVSGNIWIGARDGLYFFNTHTHQLTKHSLGKLGNKKYDIRALFLDGNNLWIGTNGDGLKIYDVKTGVVKEYYHSRDVLNTICSNDVLSIYKAHNGIIYVGTSWGLCCYDPQEDNFYVVNAIGTMISIVDIVEDMYGNLWVATSNSGVFRCQLKNGAWSHFEHRREDTTTITNNYVITLFEDMKGTMWFGTNGGGLCSFDSEKGIFIDFDPHNVLLPSKVIYSIEQDEVGDFWLSSNAGLIKINPLSKEHFRRFTVTDGLQGNQFNAHSSLKASDGKLYFGGINGFNAFRAEQFTDNQYIPPVYITDIQLPYTTDENLVHDILRLEKPLYVTPEITLPYEYNSFAISFAALSYEDPDKNRYSYMMRGVDKEWVVNARSTTASYTNLHPGQYEFVVRGSNNDSKWNMEGATILIVITPPWWRTPWAYLVYILLLLGATYYIAFRWDRYVKLRYKQRMDEFRVSKEKEIYESKISFFINLVHEIRTPLSLIRLPLEKLMESSKEVGEKKYLSVIDKNVNYLLGITTQLLDFQKMESGSLQISKASSNVNQLLEEVYEQFTGAAEIKNISLALNMPEETVFASIDRDKVRKILVNLVGNAIKFAKGHIELKLLLNNDRFEIRVNDDGMGVPDSEKQRIFEAFYQVQGKKESATGTGIGLAFSKSLAEAHQGELRLEDSEQGGSSFILVLPVGEVTSVEKDSKVQEEISDIIVEEPDAATVHATGKFTILLVEDNIELLNMTKDALSSNFHVLKAENGRKALEVLSHESVDVIVSDIMMPEMNGLELTKEVKSNIDYSHIPVILLTAKTTLESKIEGFECGADAYVEKPFSSKQLRMQIENLLKLRQAFHKLMAGLSGTTQITNPTSEFTLSQKDCEFIARIQEVINEQLSDEDFSIDSLAETVHMSRSNFYRKIKALSGMAPNDYLKTIRLNHAAELIKAGERISEVCERVGFTSSSYFAKCFKAQFGVLPREYKG